MMTTLAPLALLAFYSDSSGAYTVRVDDARTRLRMTVEAGFAEDEVTDFEIYPIDRPELAEIDWSEWMLTTRFGSTPDWTLMDEAAIIRIDGVVYGASYLD